jgi:hypothetical protein
MRSALLVVLLGLVAGTADAANDWVNLLAQDPTGGLIAGHICYTINGHDLSCDAVSPVVSGTTFIVSGTVSATAYYGDGSHLTGISTQGDRITSGTTSMVAQTASNIISITTSGVNTGYFNSNGVLTAPGISATANLTSVTTLYASGNVGIGTTNLQAALNVSGNIILSGALNGLILNQRNTGAGAWQFYSQSGDLGVYDQVSATNRMVVQAITGNVGIGTGGPTAKLEVVGNISATQVSSTNISLTTGHITGQSVTSVAGGGGDYIISGSAIVSTSSANGGTIRLSTGSGPVLTVSGSNVGIGTSNPLAGFDFAAGLTGSFSRLRIEPSGAAYGARLNWYGSNGVFANVARIDGVVTNGGDGNEAAELAFSTMANGSLAERMRISAVGNVGIGTSSPGAGLDVALGSIRATGNNTPATGAGVEIYYVTSNGFITSIDRSATAYKPLDFYGSTVTTHNTSDARLKSDVVGMSVKEGLAAISKLRPVDFTWKDTALGTPKGRQMGLIAQEVQPIYPALVSPLPTSTTIITLANGSRQTINSPLTLNYNGFIVPLIKAVQELKSAFDANRVEIERLKAQNASMRADFQRQIDQLKARMNKQ